MPRKVEPLDGGLVTDRDPAQLKPGQMSAMRNFVYRNGSTSLYPAAGRAVWGTVSGTATAVRGLRDIQFDNGNHYLIAMAGNKYRRAPVSTSTQTFSDLATIGTVSSAQTLEAVQYRNRFFLLNGATADSSAINTNTVVYLSATAVGNTPVTRQHGMLPVDAAPSIVTAGAGAFSQSVTGYYEYWTTEIAKVTQDGAEATLESAFSADSGATTQLISATSIVPTIQLPMVHNSITTGWRIYRSPVKVKATDKKFPTGFMIAELSTAASAHADTTAVASASSFPGNFNSTGFYFGFASASSMAADDGVYASATVGASPTTIQQSAYTFSLGGFTGTVVGIAIEVQGYVSAGSAPVPVNVTIGKRYATGRFTIKNLSKIGERPRFADITASKSGTLTSTNSAAPTTFTVGSSTDRWFPSNQPGLVDADFDANFMVVLSVSKANVSIGIDYVKAYVYYGGSNDSTVVFPTVVYNFGDITSQVAKNFPPPSASTGDTFQDSLVLNDVLNPSTVRYSFPGDPEAFPPTYFIDFETRDNDEITHIRTVNNRLIIGLDHSVWRLNYLPSERDSTFDRGRAVELISRSFGIYNPMCACTLTIDGESELLAFVSHKGIHTTDGFNFITRSRNQTWRNFIPSIGNSSYPIALLNDPENRVLRFYYRNDNDPVYPSDSFLCLHISYDREDIGPDGSFKFSGPVHMRNSDGVGNYGSLESVAAVPHTTGTTLFYLGYGGTDSGVGGGKVYRDGQSSTIPSDYANSTFTTRRMYMAGLSGEWELDDMYAYCGSTAGYPLATYTFQNLKTNSTEVSGPSKTFSGTANFHRVSPRMMCEGLRIVVEATGTNYSYEYLVFGSKSFGLEDSGK